VSYSVELIRQAVKQFKALSLEDQQRIAPKIDDLAIDPRPFGAIKLAGEEDLYRIRVGNYRIIYAIQDDQLIVLIVKIGHRREVYR
jgi:mRNA interferase RelE/StbE